MSLVELSSAAARRSADAAAISTADATPPAVAEVTPLSRRKELEVRGLVKSFPTRGRILAGVDFTLFHGQSVALIGANGTGKSTFLRCCLRLSVPDSGSVRLLDTELDRLGATALRKLRARVGFVFQRHNLVPRLSALTNVLQGAQARHAGPRYWLQSLAPRAIREAALHCLDQVGLADLAQQRADSLSGGQSQRVAIARMLMQEPELVFADEPVASLDPNAGEEVMELFVSLMRCRRTTLLFTSHNLAHTATYADRIVGLRNGKIALDEPAQRCELEELRQLYG
jgi:phosphonate transport system ATP-binding protein